jgi:hypothetical protein
LALGGFEMKLYRSRNYPTRWFAFSSETGWVMFPAEMNGWLKRERARGVDPIDIREVPLHLGFNTGIPGAPGAIIEEAEACDDMIGAAA